MQQQAHEVGKKTSTGRTVGRQVVLQRLDEVFTLAARAINVVVQHVGVKAAQRGNDEARALAQRHHPGLEQHAP